MPEQRVVLNDIYVLSKKFAIRIVKLYCYLKDNKNEYVISKQLLRSGTSIGANVHEAIDAQSRADFSSKMNISLKEANETLYWLDLLHETDLLNYKEYFSLYDDCNHVKAVLIKIVKATKQPNNK